MSCTNHGCILRDDTHKGMGTNSICQCARRDPIGTERRVHELLKERKSLRSQLAAVTAELAAARDNDERYRYAREHLGIGEFFPDRWNECDCEFREWTSHDIDAARSAERNVT